MRLISCTVIVAGDEFPHITPYPSVVGLLVCLSRLDDKCPCGVGDSTDNGDDD